MKTQLAILQQQFDQKLDVAIMEKMNTTLEPKVEAVVNANMNQMIDQKLLPRDLQLSEAVNSTKAANSC